MLAFVIQNVVRGKEKEELDKIKEVITVGGKWSRLKFKHGGQDLGFFLSI